VFVKYPELRKLALATIASIEDREQLERHFLRLGRLTLHSVCEYLHLVPPEAGPDITEAEYSQVTALLAPWVRDWGRRATRATLPD
jgi:hypothetical protein